MNGYQSPPDAYFTSSPYDEPSDHGRDDACPVCDKHERECKCPYDDCELNPSEVVNQSAVEHALALIAAYSEASRKLLVNYTSPTLPQIPASCEDWLRQSTPEINDSPKYRCPECGSEGNDLFCGCQWPARRIIRDRI